MTGPADFYCDNNSVVKNTSIPTSMLAKKRHTVNNHIIRESVTAGILHVAKEQDTKTNQGCPYEDSYARKETGAYKWTFVLSKRVEHCKGLS